MLIVPLLSAVLGVLVFKDRSPFEPPSRPPQPEDPAGLVPGWRGSRTLADGSELVIELLPLHANAEQQAFDAQALAARLRLADGAPWRLFLHWSEPQDAVSSTEPHAVDLAGVEVLNELGQVLLAPIPALPENASPSERLDPVRSLFEPSGRPWSRGEQRSLVVWGEVPGAAETPRLAVRGLAATGVAQGKLALESFPIPRRDVTAILARFDGRASASGSASEGKEEIERSSKLGDRAARGL